MAQPSGLGTLNTRNWIRTFVLTVATAVLTVVKTSLDEGSLTFDWKKILTVALTTAVSYILLNLGTNNKGALLTKDVPTT